MKTSSLVPCVLALAALCIVACDSTRDTTCGPGTEQVARKCIPIGDAPNDAAIEAATDSGGDTCGEGTFAREGVCLPKQPIGGACRAGEECVSGSCLMRDRGAIDGYCTIAGCSDARPCPSGAHCTFVAGDETSVCLAYCDADDDCRSEEGAYVCQPLYTSDVHVCAPSCAVKDSCSAGTRCNRESGKCEIHECDPNGLALCAGDDDAGPAGLICYAETLGLSSTGGICLPTCDPASPGDACASNEVCQPLESDPIHSGFCAPPVCSESADCPAGALCKDRVCMPPLPCDAEGACPGGDVCVSDRCMPQCPSEGGCQALHPGLRCEPTTNACLPVGAFPGSECRNVLDAPCDPLTVERANGSTDVVDMLCAADRCLPACAQGGTTLCADIAASLECAPAGIVADVPVCLPSGSFPGSECGEGGACDPLVIGDTSLPMTCGASKCLVTCDDAASGDVLCAQIDGSLQCVAGLFDEDVCLPRGAYPGGPCAPGNTCDAGMVCEQGTCLFDCSGAQGMALCEGIDDTLACATGIYATPVCLPKGSYPGGPCAAGDACAQDLSGLGAADMICADGTCLLQCETTGPFIDGDSLCATVNPALTCVSNGDADFCAPACVDDACPAGSSCLEAENACLPSG